MSVWWLVGLLAVTVVSARCGGVRGRAEGARRISVIVTGSFDPAPIAERLLQGQWDVL
ncbi:MAG: hypothetical protein HYX32_11390 [Actinobacteria bacterium]|nr:hypothetical protein [Actinomycetota bacterium]